MVFIFLTSGLFLGWSLGANDAANVFGTAVGTRMLRFKTAALIASVFVVIGAVIGGAGTTHTLGKLGAVNAIAGSFIVALSAAFTVAWMTRLRLPVSTSQAIVGAIIGWNFFAGVPTDSSALTKILLTWVLCPVLAAAIAMLLYFAVRGMLERINVRLLSMDFYTRISLVLVGAFGAYSLGANNIANVMGVFVPVVPFEPVSLFGSFELTSAQVLFFIGSVAITVGIFTYSYKVMDTVGGGLLKLSPVSALIVVLSESLVLFLFSSQTLESWLISHHLPAIPLVPVSSSQAVVGAVIGIGLARGGRGIRFGVLGEIATGWVSTPLAAGILAFISLFIFQNVFNQKVYTELEYRITPQVIRYLGEQHLPETELQPLVGKTFHNGVRLSAEIKKRTLAPNKQIAQIVQATRVTPLEIRADLIRLKLDATWYEAQQLEALRALVGKRYSYAWQLLQDLQQQSKAWQLRQPSELNKAHNEKIQLQFRELLNLFNVTNRE